MVTLYIIKQVSLTKNVKKKKNGFLIIYNASFAFTFCKTLYICALVASTVLNFNCTKVTADIPYTSKNINKTTWIGKIHFVYFCEVTL